MGKLTIDKTLSKGTPKQRAILLANHIAELNMGGKGLLSEAEFKSLSDSFRTDQEIKAYNRYRRVYDLTRNFMSNVTQARFAYAVAVEHLEKLLLIQRSNYDFEDAVNGLMDMLPSKKDKEKAVTFIKRFSKPHLLRLIEVDNEGYIKAAHDKQGTMIAEMIDTARDEAVDAQVELKTAITLIKDYMAETGLSVKVFAGMVKEIENWAKSKKGMARFDIAPRGELPLLSRRLYDFETLEIPYESVEIDKDLYKKWKEDCLE